MQTIPLAEYRCSTCGRLLFKGVVLSAYIQIKCKRCNTIVFFTPSDGPLQGIRYGFIADENGKILDVSESACEILGYSREELCSKQMGELIPPGEDANASEYTHLAKSGARIPVRVQISRHVYSRTPQMLHLCELLASVP